MGLLPQPAIRSLQKILPSAQAHPEVIIAYLEEQVQAGYMLGPFHPQDCQGVTLNSLGVIPKSTLGKFRVIVDLSSPEGYSVNDNLVRNLTHVAYSSVEDAAFMMHTLGQGTQLAKIDIQSAYRIIPIHPLERAFLGVIWGLHRLPAAIWTCMGSSYLQCSGRSP